MYLNEVYLKFTDPDAAYEAAMQKESIREEYPEAESIGDILEEHWGIISNKASTPSIYDQFEDYGDRNNMTGVGEDILNAIAPYVDPTSRIVAKEASEDFDYYTEVVTFVHKKAYWMYLDSFDQLINNRSFDESLVISCRDIICAFPKSIQNIQNEADIETFLEKIKGVLRTGLSEFLHKEMEANQADLIPPTILPKTKIAGKEICLKAGCYERIKEKSQGFSR